MDSKTYEVGGKSFRVSVLRTPPPTSCCPARQADGRMVTVAKEDGADQVLLFVIDILREEATLLVPNDLVRQVAENFACVGRCGSGRTARRL